MNGPGSDLPEAIPTGVAGDLIVELQTAKARIIELENQIQHLKQGNVAWSTYYQHLRQDQERKSLLESVIESANYPIFVIDDNDCLVVMNPAFRGLFRSGNLERKKHMHSYDLLPNEICEHIVRARKSLGSGSELFEFEWQRLRSEGNEYFRFSLSPIRDSDGTVYAIAGILDEISSIKRSQEQLAISEARFRNLVERSDNLVLRLDRHFMIEFANPTARKLLHLFSEEPSCLYLPHLVHAEDCEDMENKLQEGIASRIAQLTLENRLPPRSGESIFVQWSMQFSYDVAGHLIHVNTIARDITDRRSYEVQMRKAVEHAEAAVRTKSEFLAMISHEIRTPLNSIIGLSDLMETSNLGDEEKQMIETISLSGHGLLSLINDVLDFSKVESGYITLNKSETDLEECLEQISNLFRFKARSKGIDFEWSVEKDVPNRLLCDRDRVMQVLNNLIGNAVKFTEHGGIRVTASGELLTNVEELDLWSGSEGQRYRPYRIRIDVQDTGIGITPEQRVLLFQPFSQADQSIRRRFGGTGLGLVISRQLAKLMGGDIDLESEVSVGSTFTFWMTVDGRNELSSAQTASPERNPVAKPMDRTMGQRKPLRILVVDDVSHNRLVMKTLLSRLGYAPSMACDGMEALEWLEREPFDLIFMDMLMPDLSGMETTREIRARQYSGELKTEFIRIVALTANAMEQDRIECTEAGMDGFICKPVQFEEIQQCILDTWESIQLRA